MPEQASIHPVISEPNHVIQPTTANERIQVIDIVRGWAIFGILVVNMLRFSGYLPFQENWTGSLDQAVVWSIPVLLSHQVCNALHPAVRLGYFPPDEPR